jgi:hypothetical protein
MAITLLESTREAASIEDFLYRELQKHWAVKLVNVRERIRLIPDLYKFKAGEDPFFWAQAGGKLPRHYCVYFDNEFVCDFDSTYLPQAILLQFWRGLLKLYQERKIYFDKSLYKAEDELIKDAAKSNEHKRKTRLKKLKVAPEVKEVIHALEAEGEKK